MKKLKYLSFVLITLLLSGFVLIQEDSNTVEPTNNTEALNSTKSYPLTGAKALVETGDFFKEDVFCWKETYGRGVGTIPTICPDGMENQAGLCYTLCKDGYYGVGPVCWKYCPEGYRDDGAFCFKPESYGRGGGYIWKVGDTPFSTSGQMKRCEEANGKGNCEVYGAIVYPKCKDGFYAAGCCVCSPVCPEGFTDIGVSCQKPSYGRGVGLVPTICEDAKENNAGLCYQLCRDGFQGVGPVCWEVVCPVVNGGSWVDCGAGCAQSTNTCATAIIDMTISPLVAVLSIAGMVVSGGASGAASGTVAAVTSTGKVLKYTAKAVKGVSKVTQAAIKADLMAKAREQLNGKPMPEHQRKGIEEYASMAYDAARTYDFDWRDFAGVDPTGLASVAAAYANPLCKNIKSSPSFIASIKEVKFYSQNSLTLAQAQEIATNNGWTLASAADVLNAWTEKGLDVYAFGMMSDGRFAVPVQSNHSNFKKGPNIGAVGGNQGFFYSLVGTSAETTTAPPATSPTSNTMTPASPGFVRIQNSWYKQNYIHNQNGQIEQGVIEPNWWSSQWKIVPVHSGWVRIQNKWKPDQYLHNQNGKLEVGPIQNNWASAMWKLVPAQDGWVRIQNSWYQDKYLHNQNGKIEVGPIQTNWASALWKVE